MTPSRPIWAPATLDQARAEVTAGRVSESHYVELKGQVEGGDQGTSKLRKGLSSLAIDGGVFAIGVEEDKATGLAKAVTPVPVAGLQERIVQVAASLDPTLTGLRIEILRDPSDDTRGVFLVFVDPSLWAPHKTPDGVYFGRNNATSFKLSDAQIERLIRLRTARDDQVATMLDEFWNAQNDYIPAEGRVGYLTIVVSPIPGLSGDPFMPFMGSEYRSWLVELVKRPRDLVEPSAARPERTGTGVRLVRDNLRANYPFLGEKLEIDRDGTIRSLTNRRTETHPGQGGASVIRWLELSESIRQIIELANDLSDQLGRPFGLNIGIGLHGVKGYQPMPFDHTIGYHGSAFRRWELVPYQDDSYRSTTSINSMQARANLTPVLDSLLSGLYNSMGLPTFNQIQRQLES